MKRKFFIAVICALCFVKPACFAFEFPFELPFKVPFKKDKPEDYRSREIKHQYEVLKEDEKYKMEGKLLNRTPSGYMTVDEYEALSEYKDKYNLEYSVPKIEKPSDFKYVPQPLYKIVRYNDPPGSAELSLGKRLFIKRQINAQGIVSPDFKMLVYPAVYYYPDNATVACDLFVIPLKNDNDSNLNKILKANIANRIASPILSTEKAIDNFAAFRTLTPVDFSNDSSKLLVKEKIGSSEDGIWQTKVYVYDFKNKISYDLVEIRDAITYFWKEYMDVNLDDKRWDIVPLGFDAQYPNRVVVQAYAYTGAGSRPVYLGAWSVDWKGNQSRLVSFNKNYIPMVSSNGFKIIKDGVEAYQTVERQEKFNEEQSKVLEKQKIEQDKAAVKAIKEEYKYAIKELDADYKDEMRDYRKLQSLSGSTEDITLDEAYKKYLEDQLNKDIQKTEKQIKQKQKEIDKIDKKIEYIYNDKQKNKENDSTQVQSVQNQ